MYLVYEFCIFEKVSGYFMVTLRNLIISLLGLCLLTQCNNKQSDIGKVDFSFDLKPKLVFVSPRSVIEERFVGKWLYSFPFYSSELIINVDGTFQYHDQGCMCQSYSEGKWTINGQEITLHSFEEFKKSNAPAIIKTETKSVFVRKKNQKSKSDGLKFNLPTFSTEYSVSVKRPDTSNIYFEKLRFMLIKDTLYKLDEKGLFAESKFVKGKTTADKINFGPY